MASTSHYEVPRAEFPLEDLFQFLLSMRPQQRKASATEDSTRKIVQLDASAPHTPPPALSPARSPDVTILGGLGTDVPDFHALSHVTQNLGINSPFSVDSQASLHLADQTTLSQRRRAHVATCYNQHPNSDAEQKDYQNGIARFLSCSILGMHKMLKRNIKEDACVGSSAVIAFRGEEFRTLGYFPSTNACAIKYPDENDMAVAMQMLLVDFARAMEKVFFKGERRSLVDDKTRFKLEFIVVGDPGWKPNLSGLTCYESTGIAASGIVNPENVGVKLQIFQGTQRDDELMESYYGVVAHELIHAMDYIYLCPCLPCLSVDESYRYSQHGDTFHLKLKLVQDVMVDILGLKFGIGRARSMALDMSRGYHPSLVLLLKLHLNQTILENQLKLFHRNTIGLLDSLREAITISRNARNLE